MKRSLRVLVTGVGSTTSMCVIKGLKKQQEYEVYVVGTDTHEKNSIAGSSFCDSFYKISPATQVDNYINEVQEIIKTESVNLLIPVIDAELETIAKNREIIERLTYLLLSSYSTVIKCIDKFQTFKFFNEIGVPTSKTIIIDDIESLENLLSQSGMSFPLIAKPRKGVGSIDVYEIKNREELVMVKKVKNPLIQEKAEGQEYTIDVFCDGKKLIAAVPRKRIETKAGVSYRGQTEKDDELINYARRIAEKLNIKGPANIQCFKNGDELRFTEINPRFSGGLVLTIEAGINMPLLGLKMAAGEELNQISNFRLVRMCRYWNEVFYPI